MWEKLIELLIGLVVDKSLDGRTPKRKAAKSIVNLYLSMLNCHQAYLHFKKDENDQEAAYEWSSAVKNLASNVYQLRNALHIHDPKLFSLVAAYVSQENRAVDEYEKSRESSSHQPKPTFSNLWWREDHNVIALERFTRESLDEKEGVSSGDFQKAIKRLREFIRSNFSFDEIVDA